MRSVISRGRIRLEPGPDSAVPGALHVELELSRQDGQLTIGDLRHAAEQLEDAGRYESASRVWAIAGMAAGEADDYELWQHFENRAVEATAEAARIIADLKRRGSSRYNYRAIATERAAGDSPSVVAHRHGCSTSTVRRAVEFVERADELMAEQPDLADMLAEGIDVSRLAIDVGASVALLRWMAAQELEQRTETTPMEHRSGSSSASSSDDRSAADTAGEHSADGAGEHSADDAGEHSADGAGDANHEDHAVTRGADALIGSEGGS